MYLDKKKNAYSPRKTALSLHLVIFLLLFCSRIFDMSTTYLVTPSLVMESNVIVRFLGFGWFKFIVLNGLIITIFFFLFWISWKRYSIWKEIKYKFEMYTKDRSEYKPKSRNIALEIGIALPIYVIITGYFQGLINLMIYMEWVLIRFTNLLFLYPLIVGGIFGSISLYLTKKILYSKKSKAPSHKVRVAKRESYHEGFVAEPKEEGELVFPPPSSDDQEIQFEENRYSLIKYNDNSSSPRTMILDEERRFAK